MENETIGREVRRGKGKGERGEKVGE